MAIHIDDAQFRADVIGIPDSHAAAFKQVAVGQKCVIMCRAPGSRCKGLLEQGYDTKGFRIHGKSCDWGPMAGFVLRDPRLNKSGAAGADYNRREHRTALQDASRSGWSASVTPLKIFPERLQWLMQKRLIMPVAKGPNRYDGTATHASGIRFDYSLMKEQTPAGTVWGVYFDNRVVPFRQEGSLAGARKVALDPLLAMTNPPDHRSWPGDDFRNAITGDYDLFAIWPLNADYDHNGMDRRILGTANAWSERDRIEHEYEANFTRVQGRAQSTKVGNMTNRIYEVAQFLNSAIAGAVTATPNRTWGPFPKRMVVWHSDESARPFVNDVDLPHIAFTPAGYEIGVENIDDFKELVDVALEAGIHVSLAEGWTLNPDNAKRNRLGATYAHLVPQWARKPSGAAKPMNIPDWYNR